MFQSHLEWYGCLQHRYNKRTVVYSLKTFFLLYQKVNAKYRKRINARGKQRVTKYK